LCVKIVKLYVYWLYRLSFSLSPGPKFIHVGHMSEIFSILLFFFPENERIKVNSLNLTRI